MAQNITLMGASYSDVPSVELPKTGGGTAEFFDARTVTYNLSGGASVSAGPDNAIAGQGFTVKLKAPAGYTLSNVSVTMGGVDITSTAFVPDESGGGGGNEYTRTTIIAETTVTPTSNGTYYAATLTGMTASLEDGADYIVTIDGTEWWSTCTVLWSTNYLLGDSNYFYGSTGLPYPFGLIWTNGTSCTLAVGSGSAITISVDKVELDAGGGGSATLITKSIAANGTYNASSDSADGYSSVTVNVANSYASGDEGKVVSNGALVAQGSDTVTQNGTVDTTLISSLLVNVAAGGSSVKTGTVTPSAASTTISFDAGLSTITGILIMPVNTPLTGSRTQAAMICLSSGSFYKAISIHTNSGGTGWVSPSVYTSNRFTLSGTTVTVTGAYSFRPAVGYIWYAW